jgi:prepilin-type N-terminal cleavage/methylation domain-containing protein
MNQKGFTLIELIIGIVIASIILMMVVSIGGFAYNRIFDQTTQVEIIDQEDEVVEKPVY